MDQEIKFIKEAKKMAENMLKYKTQKMLGRCVTPDEEELSKIIIKLVDIIHSQSTHAGSKKGELK